MQVVPEKHVSSQTSTIAVLSAQPGMDVRRGLAALLGNEKRYLELLRRLVDAHRGDMAKFADSLERGDYPAALHIAHALKGSSATLGVQTVAEYAEKLQFRLRAEPSTPLELAEARSSMEAIDSALATLDAALPLPVAQAQTGRVSLPEHYRPLLDRLRRLLAENDASAIVVLEEHTSELSRVLGDSFTNFTRQIQHFDFEQAHQTLSVVLEKLPGTGKQHAV